MLIIYSFHVIACAKKKSSCNQFLFAIAYYLIIIEFFKYFSRFTFVESN